MIVGISRQVVAVVMLWCVRVFADETADCESIIQMAKVQDDKVWMIFRSNWGFVAVRKGLCEKGSHLIPVRFSPQGQLQILHHVLSVWPLRLFRGQIWHPLLSPSFLVRHFPLHPQSVVDFGISLSEAFKKQRGTTKMKMTPLPAACHSF